MNKTTITGIRAFAVLLLTSMSSLSAEPAGLQPIGTMGKMQRVLGGDKEAVLYEHQGTGCLSHFWFGGNFKGAENTRIRYYLSGKKEPLMLSSGLEDYFLGTYYFNTGKFHADIAGLTHFDEKQNSFSAYRFHDDDPVFFQDGLRLTCRCGETAQGLAEQTKAYLNPLETRFTTYTWVYQW